MRVVSVRESMPDPGSKVKADTDVYQNMIIVRLGDCFSFGWRVIGVGDEAWWIDMEPPAPLVPVIEDTRQVEI